MGEGAALLFLLLVPAAHCTNVMLPIAVLSVNTASASPVHGKNISTYRFTAQQSKITRTCHCMFEVCSLTLFIWRLALR